MSRAIEQDTELSCDEAVLRRLPQDEQRRLRQNDFVCSGATESPLLNERSQ